MRDLKSLETFVWIARLGGFRAAAQRLNTTQPALSARIRQLEQDLGVTLFEHRLRRTALTPEGVAALRYAESMLELRGEMLQAVAAPATMDGVLRLGLAETLVHTLLPQLMESIHRRYPALVLDIVVDITPNLRDQLLDGALDVVMLVGPVEDPRAVNAALCQVELGWVARADIDLPQRPLRMAELLPWPVVSFSHSSPLSAEIRRALEASGTPGLRLWGSTSLTAMTRLVLDGVGLSILPLLMAQQDLSAGRLRQLEVADVTLPRNAFHLSYLRSPKSHLAAAVAGEARRLAEHL
ncbi:hypothetical protein BKE38_06075 [Pseudoroseomonas deserti]|uniref:HTH lysR-type domain-containing protein n=1 Tax=Teichococcus deserti TaxID=1817963 RepID=A0A1V2H5N3_9PROT|nr:LysR family transcriptional regulator [Pseudoroseomonas deserti]ONG56378.1 hypothetical protein BKE38_06075 [Pseudoroseomonas deserti]